ncbi:hypothetical protein [Hyphomicrobium sp. 99]|uniref:hypothetical protein n=1 Tax=Hyphomicrobium sp. 99 TaxID=1163419 RepID=UPI0012E0334A|nr:hypothetical protein [Hyphomicrobium sp. 99]
MSKNLIFAVLVGFATISAPAASEAHCLGWDKARSGVGDVYNSTMNLANAAFYRTQRIGDRLFGWIHCDHRT